MERRKTLNHVETLCDGPKSQTPKPDMYADGSYWEDP